MAENRVPAGVRIGTAGWAIPAPLRDAFPGEGSILQRYATRFAGVEINSSFYRAHRPATYARWAASVPPDFRFAVKVPKTITHGRRLEDCGELVEAFLMEAGELCDRLGPLLIQLPPSLAFSPGIADAFFRHFREVFSGQLVCEPRHASWFTPAADELLSAHRIARVAADPAPVPEAAHPGGFGELVYFRLHGSPEIYRSPYGSQRLHDIASAVQAVRGTSTECWVIFDNTASGAAAADALELSDLLRGAR